jgi:hypothetical protein
MGLKRGVVGGHDLGPAFGQELHLHLQPPSDHRVVAVQSKDQRLAHIDLFADGRVDDLGQLRLTWRAAPGRLELGHQAPGVVLRNDDCVLRLGRRAVIQRRIKPEDHRTQQKEVNQRFLQDRHPRWANAGVHWPTPFVRIPLRSSELADASLARET